LSQQSWKFKFDFSYAVFNLKVIIINLKFILKLILFQNLKTATPTTYALFYAL